MPNADNELIDPAATRSDASADADYDGVERRRPGRPDTVNPVLVELLRQTPQPALFADPGDSLRAPTGIAVGLGISLLIWGGLFLAIRALFW